MVGLVMEPRKMRILQAITDDYIQTADPVGSRTIARKYALGVSPATIRNEMADLEELGYLEQPHTSAGRIPSDKGYRFYVDELMAPEEVSDEDRAQLREEVVAMQRAMEQVVHRATRLLSLLTRYTAVVMAPRLTEAVIKQIYLSLLDPHHVLAVLVFEPGFVENHILQLKRPIDEEGVARIARRLNEHLVGTSLRELTRTLVDQVSEETAALAADVEIIDLIARGLGERGAEKVYLEGTAHLFEQPEFRDVDRVKLLLGFLEQEDMLASILSETSARSGVQVTIGQEHRQAEMRDCSMVTATYSVGGSVIGTLGVVGPTRLDYSKVVSAVGMMAELLSEILTQAAKRR